MSGEGRRARGATLWKAALPAGLVCVLAFLLMGPMVYTRPLIRDEHSFVASGALLARDGWLPYRDYAYFHMPYLVFVYAALFKLSGYLVLTVRTFSMACAALGVGVVFALARAAVGAAGGSAAAGIAVGAALLHMATPMFRYTVGQSWNHDLPTLLALAAFLACWRASRSAAAGRWMTASGFLIGLATGTRLTYLLLAAPGLAAALLLPGADGWRHRSRLALAFGAGFGVALLPALWSFVTAPEAFVFGNLEAPRLNTRFRLEAGHRVAMDLSGKLGYLKDVLREPGHLVLVVGLAVAVPWSRMTARAPRGRIEFGLALSLLVALFLLLGSFAPTPSWPQYFYAPVPFVVLAIVFGLAARARSGAAGRLARHLFAVLVVIAVAWGYKDYRRPSLWLKTDQWAPLRAHHVGDRLAAMIPKGRVLTMTAIFPLEGGLPIYRGFVSVPPAWRTGHMIAEERRRRLHVVTPADLKRYLERQEPDAILVGAEPGFEEPLLSYARAHGYRAMPVGDGLVVWRRPGVGDGLGREQP